MSAIVKVHSLRGNIQDAIDYILDENKTEPMLTSCTNCNVPQLAGTVWKYQQHIRFDDRLNSDGVQGYHFILSFDDMNVTSEQVHDIAERFLSEATNDEYDDVIAVHTNTDHLHAHIIVNPINKNTNKKWNIYFKKEINFFKEIENRICKDYGIEPLPIKRGTSRSWWKHHNEKMGDGHDTIITKTLDYLVNKVQSYEQLKIYLTNIGYTVEDDLDAVKQIDENRLRNFEFTINKKLINESFSDEYSYFIRIPFTNEYFQIPIENGTWVNAEKNTLKCKMDLTKNYVIYDKAANIINSNKSGRIISQNLEEKNCRGIREGLRIKVPGSKYFRRCKYLKNRENLDLHYSLDDIIERIRNNNVDELDPNIANVINVKPEGKRQKEIKNVFYDNANIKTKYNQSDFYTMSKQQKYIHFKSKEIQNILDRIATSSDTFNDVLNLSNLKDIRRQISKELRNINEKIKMFENKYDELMEQVMEGIIDATDDEIEKFVGENITPLRQEKFKLKIEHKNISERISKAEKNTEIYK